MLLLNPFPVSPSRLLWPLAFLGNFPGYGKIGLHHNCLSARHTSKVGTMVVVPFYLSPVYTLRDTHKKQPLVPDPQADTRKFTQTHIYSPTQFRFPCGNACFALLSQEGGVGVVRECPPPPLFHRSFWALEVGGLSRSLPALGFMDPLNTDCSLWGDWGRNQDIVGRRPGSSGFQETHPGLVQATINICL